MLVLGEKFNLRRFHNAVLDNGALPLDALEAHCVLDFSRKTPSLDIAIMPESSRMMTGVSSSRRI